MSTLTVVLYVPPINREFVVPPGRHEFVVLPTNRVFLVPSRA